MSQDLHLQTLTQLAAGLESGSFSSVDVTEALLKRIESHNGTLNAFITITAEQALAAARRQDEARASGNAGVLNGLPIVHKDIFCTRDVLTTCGSRMLENFVSPYNATVVERMAEAGAVMLGKSNMDEFAMGSSNETSFFGPVMNPWKAGSTDRYCRVKANVWPCFALRHDRVRIEPRPGGRHYSQYGRCSDAARCYGRV